MAHKLGGALTTAAGSRRYGGGALSSLVDAELNTGGCEHWQSFGHGGWKRAATGGDGLPFAVEIGAQVR